jgi:hypothetical protein
MAILGGFEIAFEKDEIDADILTSLSDGWPEFQIPTPMIIHMVAEKLFDAHRRASCCMFP